jgi:hypothetical protein
MSVLCHWPHLNLFRIETLLHSNQHLTPPYRITHTSHAPLLHLYLARIFSRVTHNLALLHPCAAQFESCVALTHFTHRTRTCLEHYAHTNVDFPLTSTHSCYTRMSRTHLSTFMLPSQGHCLHSNSVVSRTCLSQHHTRLQSAALISLVELYTCTSHKHFTRISLTSLRKHLLADLLHSVTLICCMCQS